MSGGSGAGHIWCRKRYHHKLQRPLRNSIAVPGEGGRAVATKVRGGSIRLLPEAKPPFSRGSRNVDGSVMGRAMGGYQKGDVASKEKGKAREEEHKNAATPW